MTFRGKVRRTLMTECAVEQVRVLANNTSPLTDLSAVFKSSQETSSTCGLESILRHSGNFRRGMNRIPRWCTSRAVFTSRWRNSCILSAVIFIFIDSSLEPVLDPYRYPFRDSFNSPILATDCYHKYYVRKLFRSRGTECARLIG